MKLSSTRIRFLKPRKKISRLSDGGGLSLEVRPSGSCLWRYRYRIDGKENVFAIGSFPEMSLKAAREARDEAKKLVERGIHPAHQRRAERDRALRGNADSFGAVAGEWLEANRSRWTPRSFQQRRRLLERDVLPHIGELPMSEVTAGHCLAVLKRIEARAPHTAALARQCVSAISRFAIATQRSERDLAYSLKTMLSTAPRGRRRQLSQTEIPGFFEALERYPGHPHTRAAIRLLWLTLARPKDVVSARWEDFDLRSANWSIPAENTSAHGPHKVVLSRQAVELLDGWQAAMGTAEYLVPNRLDPKRPAAQSILIKALTRMGCGGTLTPQGIRLTGKSILADQDFRREALEGQLGYAGARASSDTGLERDRREMMQWWADFIDSLRVGGDGVGENVM